MKFDNVILDRCSCCGSTKDLSAYLITYDIDDDLNPDMLAQCLDCDVTTPFDSEHTKMTVEEAKLYVIKSKL